MGNDCVKPKDTREFLRGLSDWLDTEEGRREASKWSSEAKDEVALAKILMHRMASKVNPGRN